MDWMHTIRRRALWIVVVAGAVVLGLIFTTTIPAWPVLGVAVAAVAFAINGVAARLETTSCLACGADLADQPVGIRGRLCPKCGAINERGIADPEQRADAGGADDAPQA